MDRAKFGGTKDYRRATLTFSFIIFTLFVKKKHFEDLILKNFRGGKIYVNMLASLSFP